MPAQPLAEIDAPNTTSPAAAAKRRYDDYNSEDFEGFYDPDEVVVVDDDDDEDDEDDDDAVSTTSSDRFLSEPLKWNCNQVRAKIRRFIDNGGMTAAAFQRAIGVNPNSYRNFMAMNKPYQGEGNGTYHGAYVFFRRREEQKLPMPRKKATTTPTKAAANASKKKKTPAAGAENDDGVESDSEAEGAAAEAGTSKSPAKKGKKATLTDFGDITLPGEEDKKVKIYDSCDEIRRKINAHLAKPDVTQAAFLKDIAAACRVPSIQGKQLSDFRSKRGPDSGNTSRVYYGSYVFFEKLRLKEGKPKSKHRLEMEKAWKNGVETSHRMDRIIMSMDEYATMDHLGQVTVHKKPRRR